MTPNQVRVWQDRDNYMYCPFCGSTGVVVTSEWEVTSSKWEEEAARYVEFIDAYVIQKSVVKCTSCCCKLESVYGTEEDLKRLWNTRVIELTNTDTEPIKKPANNRRKLLL